MQHLNGKTGGENRLQRVESVTYALVLNPAIRSIQRIVLRISLPSPNPALLQGIPCLRGQFD